MNILFLQDNAINDSLGLMELSTCLKEHGHSTDVLIEKEERDLFKKMSEIDPDIVIVPFQVMAENWFFPFYKKVKNAIKPETILITGGTYPSFYPDLIEHPDVDILFRGEAEDAVLEFVEHVKNKKDYFGVQNFSFKKNGKTIHNPIRQLSEKLYAGDRDLYYKRYPFMGSFSWKRFSSGRGCIHSCSFCYNQAFQKLYGHAGSFTRQKEPAALVEEILKVKTDYGLRTVHFSDDLFTIDKNWVREFAKLYREKVKIPLSVNTSAELLSKEVVESLALAGTRMVAIGLETGNESLRKTILNKNRSNELIKAKAKLVKDAGIKLLTFNMVGFPGERVEDVLSTLKFNQEIRADYIRIGLATPIPNTEMANLAKKMGLYSVDDTNKQLNILRQESRLPIRTIENEDDYLKLYYLAKLYPWIKFSHIETLWKFLPINQLSSSLELFGVLNEKIVNRIGWLEGLRYYYHVGSPQHRTTNYVSLI